MWLDTNASTAESLKGRSGKNPVLLTYVAPRGDGNYFVKFSYQQQITNSIFGCLVVAIKKYIRFRQSEDYGARRRNADGRHKN